RRDDGAAQGRHGILVSGGGGRFAEPLYATAIAAHAQLGDDAAPMTIVAGPLCPDDQVARLRAAAAAWPTVCVERSVADLYGAMRGAALSISQCGYNTALDIVRAGVPAIVVPFDENGDSEQTVRARRLERLGALRVLSAGSGTTALAGAIRAAAGFHP